MDSQKINLQKILNDYRNKYFMTTENYVILAMKEACRRALDLAVKKLKSDAMEEYGTDIQDCWDEQSIYNVLNLIE